MDDIATVLRDIAEYPDRVPPARDLWVRGRRRRLSRAGTVLLPVVLMVVGLAAIAQPDRSTEEVVAGRTQELPASGATAAEARGSLLDGLVAKTASSPGDTANRYHYLHVTGLGSDETAGPAEQAEELVVAYDQRRWLARDGSGRITVGGRQTDYGPGELLAGRPPLDAMPADTAELRAVLDERYGGASLASVRWALEAGAAPSVRAAFLGLLRAMDDVRVTSGTTADPSARAAVLISADETTGSGTVTTTLYVDPGSGRLLQVRSERIGTDGERLLEDVVVLADTHVDDIATIPPDTFRVPRTAG